MSRIDELETLSQLLADEPSRAAPGRDLDALAQLDRATAALSVELPQAHRDRLVRAALPRRRRSGGLAVAAALAFIALAAALGSGRSKPDAVTVLVLPQGVMELAPGTQVEPGVPPVLVLGAALLAGRGEILSGGTRVSIDGTVLVAREPPEVVDRVTSSGGDMTTWKKIAVPAAVAGALAFGVLVMDGVAHVTPEGSPTKELHAGSRLQLGDGKPPLEPGPTIAQGTTSGPDRAPSPEDPVAELRRLREEKEQLLKERSRLRAELVAANKTAAGVMDSSPMNASHYRFSQAELEQMAKSGMTLFRLPHLDAGTLPYDDRSRTDLALTPEEEAGIRRIYAESFERIRSGLTGIYLAMGGDAAKVAGATPSTLWHDILELRPAQERADATREAARVRAGLSPPTVGGPPSLQVDLLLQGEDERVIAELDALLGPERAQQLLDDHGTSHSDFVSVHHPDGG